jgi:hypothetical protein
MKLLPIASAFVVAGLLAGAPAFAQQTTTPQDKQAAGQPSVKQKTDGNAPTTVGPGSGAYKQKTDGNSPTTVGPGSGAFKQNGG